MTTGNSTGNVLVVDDNAAFRSAVADVAKLAQCKVTSAGTLDAARKIAADREFDLLMIDITLPDGNGLDLVENLDLAAQGQIAIVTGHPTIETAVRAVRSPVVEYLVKPVSTDILIKLMEDASLRARMRRPAPGNQLAGMIG